MLPQEKLVATLEFDLISHSAKDAIATPQVLQYEAARLCHDASVDPRHVMIVFEYQIGVRPSQGGFRLFQSKLFNDLTRQHDVFELGSHGTTLQFRWCSPYHRALGGAGVLRFVQALRGESKQILSQEKDIPRDKFGILSLPDERPARATEILQKQLTFAIR